MKIKTLDDMEFKGRTVIVRPDFNVPIDPTTKTIKDDSRIRSHAETIRELIERGAKVVILAHQGRPGEPDFLESLEIHAKRLSEILNRPVKYVHDLYGEAAKKAIRELKEGEVLVLKNVRTYPYETKKLSPEEHAKSEMVEALSSLADIFVLDGFSVAHRSHASVVGFTRRLPSCMGRVMERELRALSRIFERSERPCICILGGAKAEKGTKAIENLLKKDIADKVLLGGLIGQLLLVASGVDLGKPNIEFLKKKGIYEHLPKARELLREFAGRIELPVDVAIDIEGRRKELSTGELPTQYLIYDIGTETAKRYSEVIKTARSILVSGPLGAYEKDQFVKGTEIVFKTIAESGVFSLAGGGDTLAALRKIGLYDKFSYVSLAGGAFVEYITGSKLPGIEALKSSVLRKC